MNVMEGVIVENKLYMGVDPGKNGYICIMYDGQIDTFDIPMIGKEVDLLGLYKIIETISSSAIMSERKMYCVLEDVHAIFGSAAKATFSFGFIAGVIEAYIISCNIPYTKVAPKKWQKQMWEGVPLQQKKSSTGKTMVTDTKSMSEMAAKRMFPDIDLRPNGCTARCKKAHDGKVDALLLAEYCRRNF